MNLAWKSLHRVFMQNEKENTQHLDKECAKKAKTVLEYYTGKTEKNSKSSHMRSQNLKKYTVVFF